MRPLRLLLDGFGSYREPAEVDFSDVEFFALVGPTGAGKSTVIDGLCFALYGTVPRWGRENAIAQALAPAANACRVCLVFESAGQRYGAVRALTRDARGVVHTKRAQLELLDPSVPADAPLADILAASVEALAEGPDEVKAAVQQMLGLSYEHFTQSVLLPQGKFSEFLHAKAAERQDLLVELLAFGVYNTIGQLSRRRADLAADRMRTAQAARAHLNGATEEAQQRAQARVTELTQLTQAVEQHLESLGQLRESAQRAAAEALEVSQAAGLLGAVKTPADVPGLARRISDADQLAAESARLRDDVEKTEAAAKQARDALPDKTAMEMLRTAYAERGALASRLEQQGREQVARQADLDTAAAELAAAQDRLRQARDDQAQADRAHAAAALGQDLRIGEDCPVCLRPVTALPHHAVPADLAEAAAAARSAEQHQASSQTAFNQAASRAAVAASAVEATREQADRVSATLAGAPAEADVRAAIEAIAAADTALGLAQQQARTCRAAVAEAERARSALGEEERRARAGLSTARDSVIQLGAPAIDNADLAVAWAALTDWARQRHQERTGRLPGLETVASAAWTEVTSAEDSLAALLAGHGIAEGAEPERAAAAVATHRERAANLLAAVRDDAKKAARLDQEIGAYREEQQVAAKLGQLLRATSFERWLCGEALDSLVAEASVMLMELSAGQYQLDRNDRNDLVVIDYADAGAERPVHTLSGGETFQASLALALALSRQVIGLSAGMREMNSMFLDEGFGTLDEDTLETVGTTLERLATDSDRMIGIITHVPALAERVPVRFVVSRTGTSSALRKERT
jgi:DNA repair protein SbcC/Rad50